MKSWKILKKSYKVLRLLWEFLKTMRNYGKILKDTLKNSEGRETDNYWERLLYGMRQFLSHLQGYICSSRLWRHSHRAGVESLRVGCVDYSHRHRKAICNYGLGKIWGWQRAGQGFTYLSHKGIHLVQNALSLNKKCRDTQARRLSFSKKWSFLLDSTIHNWELALTNSRSFCMSSLYLPLLRFLLNHIDCEKTKPIGRKILQLHHLVSKYR